MCCYRTVVLWVQQYTSRHFLGSSIHGYGACTGPHPAGEPAGQRGPDGGHGFVRREDPSPGDDAGVSKKVNIINDTKSESREMGIALR